MNSKTKKIKKEVKKCVNKKEKICKKSSDAEVLKIIDFLSDNRDFEHPTAQIYYKKFLEEKQVDATWDIVKWKVRYLKTCFGNAEKWRSNTGAGILAEDAENGITTVNDKLRKMCLHYDRLKDIFGEKRSVEMKMLDSDFSDKDFLGFFDSDDLETETDVASPILPMETSDDPVDVEIIPSEITVTASQQSSAKKVSSFAEKLKRSAPKDSLSHLSKFQADRNENERLKLDFNKEKFEKELSFSKEKFDAELSIKKQELDLKKIEIEKDEKLKILEIEKNERIAKYELDLKYKKN